MKLQLEYFHQSLPLAKAFKISRGAKTSAEVVVAVISDGQHYGWGEAVPYGRYGESIESVSAQIDQCAALLKNAEADHAQIIAQMSAGSARNAVDCAFWDFKCKREGKSINSLIDVPAIMQHCTAQTLCVDSLEVMRNDAQQLKDAKLIKIKFDADNVLGKMQAIYEQVPNSRFIIDANEAWDANILEKVLDPLEKMNVALIEQPLPAGSDDDLRNINSPIPLCADESCHTSKTLGELVHKYDCINIKLDKTGGLSEALELAKAAKKHNLSIMLGCMVGSSLAMAPAFALANYADFVDLDGPLIVASDRENGFAFDNGLMQSHSSILWGNANQQASLSQITQLIHSK